MNTIELKDLNKIPVRTKEWLKVNNITINNFEMPVIKVFNNTTVIGNVNKVNIERLNKNSLTYLDRSFTYGVGDELIKQGQREFNEGLLIEIKKGTKVDEPVIIEFNMDKENNVLVDNLIIVAKENSEAKIIIKYSSIDDSEVYHNGICRVIAEDNSNIQVVKVNLLNPNAIHLDSSVSDIQESARVDFVGVDLGGKYSITNYHGNLLYSKSTSTINSLYLGDKNKVIDINYIISHNGVESESNMNVKGALKDHSKKIFKGTLDFKKGASKSRGVEDEYCMLLSNTVKSIAVPLLLCHEDDVSGEHSASSGKIDEDKLFYLMSRGLSYDESRLLIIRAAFNPIVDLIDNKSIREEILMEVDRRIINE